jgi:hypothetical protein
MNTSTGIYFGCIYYDYFIFQCSLSFFKDSWLGVLHHIAGEHEWVDGECEHGPLVATEVDKTYLDKNSKAFETLRI